MAFFGKLSAPKAEIHIITDRCKGCGFCVEYCPQGILELSDEFNAKGYHPPRVVNEDKCIGCMLCEAMCPDFSIFIVVQEQTLPVREE